MSDDEVIILSGNSPAFRSIAISLTIFLGALIGAILLCELAVFLYQRVIRKNRTEDVRSGGGNSRVCKRLISFYFGVYSQLLKTVAFTGSVQ